MGGRVLAHTVFAAACVIVGAVTGYLLQKYVDVELTPVISTSRGDVVGFVDTSREGKPFYKFLGLPFANPPTGMWRYEPPRPVDGWKGVFSATSYGSRCVQINSITRKFEGSENCLFLNIFTPVRHSLYNRWTKLLPTFVYIHGGYFMTGSSDFMGPHYLMEENIVLVTINYRLNSFGFLNSGRGYGNMGMKDQVMALKFIQEEIRHFGGDPDNVILWGESAGAAAVHFHLLSPMSKGLFRKAIMSSGTAIKPWSLVNDPKLQSTKFAQKVGCPSETVTAMMSCLKSLKKEELLKAHVGALDSPIMDQFEIFAPSIEASNETDSFLAEHPYDILKSGRAHRVPLMTGVNSHEGLLGTARMYFNKTLAKYVETNWNRLSPIFFAYDSALVNVTQKIRQFYFGEEDKLQFYEMFQNITNIFSDRWYIHSFRETIHIQSQYSPVYIYYFSYRLERGLVFFHSINQENSVLFEILYQLATEFFNKMIYGYRTEYLGTVHGDELVLLFNFPLFYIDVGDKDYSLSRAMIETLVDFATDENSMLIGNTQWLAYNKSDKQRQKYMFFRNVENDVGVLIDEPFTERMEFWDSLGLSWKHKPPTS